LNHFQIHIPATCVKAPGVIFYKWNMHNYAYNPFNSECELKFRTAFFWSLFKGVLFTFK